MATGLGGCDLHGSQIELPESKRRRPKEGNVVIDAAERFAPETTRGSLLRLIASVFLCSQLVGAEEPSKLIAGRWRSLATSRGGIGAIYEFRRDGTVLFSTGAVVEIRYRIEGGQLVLPPATKDGPEQKQSIRWLGNDKLRLESTGEAGIDLARKGSGGDAKRSILGEWAGTREMGGQRVESMYFFYPDGKGLLLIPFGLKRGRYSVKGDAIHLELPNQRPVDATLGVEDGVLSLSYANGDRSTRLARY